MHDREAKLAGPVKSTAVIASEIRTLLIEFGYSTDGPVSRANWVPLLLFVYSSAETAPNAFGATARRFSFAFLRGFCEEEDYNFSQTKEGDYEN